MCGGKTEERARDTETEILTAWTEPKATRMEGGFTFIALPLGLMFFLSGFIINVFQVRHSYIQKPFPSFLAHFSPSFGISNLVLWRTLCVIIDFLVAIFTRVCNAGLGFLCIVDCT